MLSLAGNLRKTIQMMKESFSVTREMNELGVLREDLDIRNSKYAYERGNNRLGIHVSKGWN